MTEYYIPIKNIVGKICIKAEKCYNIMLSEKTQDI